MDQFVKNWAVCFVSEFDGVAAQCKVKHASHRVWRHYPGPGGISMAFIANGSWRHAVQWVKWRGRAGAMLLHLSRAAGQNSEEHSSQHDSASCSLLLVGVHGSHTDPASSLADVSRLCQRRPPGCLVLAVGDWNIDLLPAMASDPFQHERRRQTMHGDRPQLLQALADARSLELLEIAAVRGSPGAQWDAPLLHAPFSRVPIGEQSDTPSLIDFALSSMGVHSECELDWRLALADHAGVVVRLLSLRPPPRQPSSTWQCRDIVAAQTDLATWRSPSVGSRERCSWPELRLALVEWQQGWADRRSCRERRRDRIPVEARALWAAARASPCPREQAALRREAWKKCKQHFKQCSVAVTNERVASGRVIGKRCPLKSIDALKLPAGLCSDQVAIARHIATHFAAKWGKGSLHSRELQNDFLAAHEHVPINITVDELSEAFKAMGAQSKLHGDGTTSVALRWFFFVHPLWLQDVVNATVASSNAMQQLQAHMRPGGKRTRIPELSQIRAVVPQPPLLAIIDHVLSKRLHAFVDSRFGQLEGVHHGALPGTQVLDIAHSASLLMEKCTDTQGKGAISQMDIASYFDALPCVSVVQWLVSQGLPASLGAAVVRHQLLVQVLVNFRGALWPVGVRSSGTLTGSRTAGALARVPIQEAFESLYAELRVLAYRIPNSISLVGMSYVDNLYCASDSAAKAVAMCERLAQWLWRRWQLEIKEGSKECLLARGSSEASSSPPPGWQYRTRSMHMLGHVVACDGGWGPDFQMFFEKAWATFFANSGSAKGKALHVGRRVNLLQRTVLPHVRWSSVLWAPCTTVERKLNGMQHTMLSICMGVARYPDETDVTYFRRRSKAVASEARKLGTWSSLHVRLCSNWQQHCVRHVHDSPWTGALLAWQDADWFQHRRLE